MSRPLTVGVRELKTRLGSYLRRVREGGRIVVTERGTPVAEVRPLSGSAHGLEARLARLEALGVVSQPTLPSLRPMRPVRSRGRSLAQAVIDGREDRF
jgi:prevent-host-death family protein